MIILEKTPPPLTGADEAEQNRFERIRKAAAERHRMSDTDGRDRRRRQMIETNRLI